MLGRACGRMHKPVGGRSSSAGTANPTAISCTNVAANTHSLVFFPQKKREVKVHTLGMTWKQIRGFSFHRHQEARAQLSELRRVAWATSSTDNLSHSGAGDTRVLGCCGAIMNDQLPRNDQKWWPCARNNGPRANKCQKHNNNV